ncbi:MAG: NAD(P)H-hydrate dehydratase [Desulfovibrio sp.]|jgi:NAD(P)H-hydrate epimerase|nr:NAD(P)H-hydrate dehydratase [Desulfovibrio sp.]
MNSLLPLYTPLPTPEEMRRWDEAARNIFGIPPLLLMENAAQAAHAVLKEHYSLCPESTILIFMGRGNNGGDGAALARLLHDAGHTVLVCPSGPLDELKGPAGEHADMARKMGVSFLPAASEELPVLPLEWRSPNVVIDALTGTGIRGRLRDRERAIVETINSLRDKSFIFSLDIPSGLCGLTGRPQPEAVRAHATVSFEAGKPGLYLPEAGAFTGVVSVRRIGMPFALRTMMLTSWLLLEPQKDAWAAPPPTQHKGAAGKTLIIGGSEGMAGAPLLAALGSLRAGAGLVHAAVPGALESAIRTAYPEILVHSVGTGTRWSEGDATFLPALLRELSPGALVIGPGMGRNAGAREAVRSVLAEEKRPPAVVDADALSFFRLPDQNADAASRAPDTARALPDEQAKRHCPPLPLTLLTEKDILTPHPGEMAAMLPPSFFAEAAAEGGAANAGAVMRDRPGALRALTRECGSVVVLKGAGTLIGRHNRPVVLSPVAAPTLAIGGSGDVLSGICAAVAASGVSSFDAACLAVYLHARAGELLARKAPRGHLARDIADAVPLVWKELCE